MAGSDVCGESFEDGAQVDKKLDDHRGFAGSGINAGEQQCSSCLLSDPRVRELLDGVPDEVAQIPGYSGNNDEVDTGR